MEKKRIMFLDRDGIINVSPPPGSYVTNWDDFVFTDNIITVLKYFCKLGFKLFVVTNQQCIGKNILSSDDLKIIHNKMLNVFVDNEIEITNIYYCPHLISERCQCRKPKPGLLQKAARDYNFQSDEFHEIFMLGDSETDIIAGKSFGCKTILKQGNNVKDKINHSKADIVYNENLELLRIIQ